MMSLPGKKEVIDGEQHIYSVTPQDHCRIQQEHPKVVCTHPRVLTNTHMRNIGCWQQEKCSKKKDSNEDRGKGKRKGKGVHGGHGPSTVIMNEPENAYSIPKLCSSLHVAERLTRAREVQPNVPQLLRTKLYSPNTAAKLKKQVNTFVQVTASLILQEICSVFCSFHV